MVEAGECSAAKGSSDEIWAMLVPSDTKYSEVEIRTDEMMICSEITSSSPVKHQWCKITRHPDLTSATMLNKSSNTILVDDTLVQNEDDMVIKCGSEIISGPKKEGYLSYRFKVLFKPESCPQQLKVSLDVEHAKCSICLNIWHDVVTIAPCFHNFCNGCFSEWLRRSEEKRSKVICPQCRALVQFVGRNHFLHNIEEGILQADSSLRRTDEDIAQLNSYAVVKSNLVIQTGKKHHRKRAHPQLSEEVDETVLSCPQCGIGYGGFRCNPNTVHIQCHGCGGLMPSRANAGVPQSCLGCDRAFCGAYWHSQRVMTTNSHTVCSFETFKPISERTISRVPFVAHEKSRHEQDVTDKCIRQMGRTLQEIIADWVAKLNNREIDRTRMPLNHADMITASTHLCKKMSRKKPQSRSMRDVIAFEEESNLCGSHRIQRMRDVSSSQHMSASNPSAQPSSSASLYERRNATSDRAVRMMDAITLGDGSTLRGVTSKRVMDIGTPTLEHTDDIDRNVNTDSGDNLKKKGRGSAKVWKGWGTEKKILEWTHLNQPTGENASKLNNHLGTYARNSQLFPLTWLNWNSMDKLTLENIWNDIKQNTNAPDGYKDLCFKKLGLQWKSFKNRLKKDYYEVYDTDDLRLANPPPNVEAAQWAELVRYWGTKEAQELSIRNAANRESLSCHPRTGRTSFATLKEKRRNNNEPIDHLSFWRATRSRNGKFSEDDGAAGKEESIRRKLEALTEEEQADPEIREKIFRDEFGFSGHGRVLGVGVDVRPSQIVSSSSSGGGRPNKIERLQDEIEELKAKHIEEIKFLKKEMTLEIEAVAKNAQEMESRLLRAIQSAGINFQLDSSTPTSGQGSRLGSNPISLETNEKKNSNRNEGCDGGDGSNGADGANE